MRHLALSLADIDAAAYRNVLSVQRDRHAHRLHQALADATDPLVSIIETAGEVTRLAADAVDDARGGVRGEAITATTLAAAVTRAGVSLVELNLANAPNDPRRARVLHVAQAADAELARNHRRQIPPGIEEISR